MSKQSGAHTKGPWTVGPMHGTVRPAGHERIGIANDGCVICTVHGHSERPANARLIAAAPKLLAMCQELAECADYWSEYDVPLGIADRLNAAIAEATGGITDDCRFGEEA